MLVKKDPLSPTHPNKINLQHTERPREGLREMLPMTTYLNTSSAFPAK
mgnify:FL=1